MTIKGTPGDNVLDGTGGADEFLLFQGGNDTATGDAGNDIFVMRDTLTAADAIDGGADFDTVELRGDYSGGLSFGPGTIVNVELLHLGGPDSYNLTMDDGNVASHGVLAIDARFVGGTLTFDGSAETDGRFVVRSGAGNDVLTGGAGNDGFWLGKGGNDTAIGGGGDDAFKFFKTFTAADSIDGGTGNDRVSMHGGANVTFGAATMINVESLVVNSDAATTLITNDATVATKGTLTVDATRMTSAGLTFNGSAETDGTFHVTGGGGADTLTGGSGSDILTGGGGADTLSGGPGSDTFVYALASESPGDAYAHIDKITDFDATGDLLQFPIVAHFITTVSATVNDLPDLSSAVDPWVEAGSHGVVLVNVTGGTLAGLTLLFVDFNNDGSWSGAADVVIDVTGISNPASLGSEDFVT